MKVAIVGSRDYPDLNKVQYYVESLPWDTTVISGGARGVDTTAENAAVALRLGVEVHPADWDRLGKSAGYIRNEKMVDAADRVVAFWDGESKGTKHSIDLALRKRKNLEVIFP